MLRITTDEHDGGITFRLEGKLTGPWTAVARETWERQLAEHGHEPIQIDLRGVSFVDDAGRELLAEMCRRRASFLAGDCQMKAILAELTRPGDAGR